MGAKNPPNRVAKEAIASLSKTLLITSLAVLGLTGCKDIVSTQVEAQPRRGQGQSSPTVEVAIARPERLQEPITYTGNTQPVREVSLRSQAEGRLLQLNVDVGDRIQKGQIIARLDDTLWQTALNEAEAQLTALESEVARARNQVRNAKVRAEQARFELQQAQADTKRYIDLAQAGVVSRQQAEVAQTNADVAAQTLRSAQEQIRIETDAVTTAQARVNAQSSTVAQAKERLSYATVTSPIAGVVLGRVTEPGNLVQPGGEILKLGDFSQVKVVVPVSELGLSEIQVGQIVNVRLDAFAGQTIQGRVSRISPAADTTARQVPVEVIVTNPQGAIGSGLLARVEFGSEAIQRVVIPETALQGEAKDNQATVFILDRDKEAAKVEARSVQLGDRHNGKIEILSGLKSGESFVVRSSRPLKTDESVRLSVLSES